jgi:hypothetical protein
MKNRAVARPVRSARVPNQALGGVVFGIAW